MRNNMELQTAGEAGSGTKTCMFGFALAGLQDFLYDLSSETPSREERLAEGGRDTDAATRLRTRSAILTLIPSLVAWSLKEQDPNTKILYLGGGKLFARTRHEAALSVQSKLEELYRWLVKSSRGALGAYWCNLDDTGRLSRDLRQLIEKLNVAKWQSGRPNGWHSAVGKVARHSVTDQLGDKDWEAREGKEFAKRPFVGFKVGFGDWKVGPWQAGPVESSPDIWLAGKDAPQGALTIAIPTHTPKFTTPATDGERRYEPGDTIPLHLLAERAGDNEPRDVGAPYLALLKLDGDQIGYHMHQALSSDDNLEQYSEFSSKLTKFFGEQVMGMLAKRFPRLYLVYSGGDDLVACGWFEDVLEAAATVRNEFERQGLSATVSAGITFFTRSAPILRAIEAAMEQLDAAKEAGRNRVGIGGCVMTWDEFMKASAYIDALEKAVTSNAINRGALQLLRQLGEAWLPTAPETQQSRRWASIPMMHYMATRREYVSDSLDKQPQTEWEQAVKNLFESLQCGETNWPHAALIGTLAAWKTKKRQEEYDYA